MAPVRPGTTPQKPAGPQQLAVHGSRKLDTSKQDWCPHQRARDWRCAARGPHRWVSVCLQHTAPGRALCGQRELPQARAPTCAPGPHPQETGGETEVRRDPGSYPAATSTPGLPSWLWPQSHGQLRLQGQARFSGARCPVFHRQVHSSEPASTRADVSPRADVCCLGGGGGPSGRPWACCPHSGHQASSDRPTPWLIRLSTARGDLPHPRPGQPLAFRLLPVAGRLARLGLLLPALQKPLQRKGLPPSCTRDPPSTLLAFGEKERKHLWGPLCPENCAWRRRTLPLPPHMPWSTTLGPSLQAWRAGGVQGDRRPRSAVGPAPMSPTLP